jgi:hypothetical protein
MHETPRSTPLAAVATSDQDVPSQCSTSGRPGWCLMYVPTAKQFVAVVQETPSSSFTRAWFRLSVDVTDHCAPFHRTARV